MSCAPSRHPLLTAIVLVPFACSAGTAQTPVVAPVRTSEPPAAASVETRASVWSDLDLESEVDEGEPDEPELETPPLVHPLRALSKEEIRARLKSDPESLGSISVGLPNGGRLLNGVRLPEDPRWVLVDPANAYGTRETVDYVIAAIAEVVEQHPGTPPLHIGHLSAPRGGPLRPHLSHQSGRDVDLGYYYRGGEAWYQRATRQNLDLARSWTLVKALVSHTDVRFILIDRSVQALLREHALTSGEDPEWVADLFDGTPGKSSALIRHAPGHASHLHVRFYNPLAQESGRLTYQALVEEKVVEPPTHYISHRVAKGETLVHLAKRYGTTVREIKRANRLRSNTILAKKTYKIPSKGPATSGEPPGVPPRRVPPASATDEGS